MGRKTDEEIIKQISDILKEQARLIDESRFLTDDTNEDDRVKIQSNTHLICGYTDKVRGLEWCLMGNVLPLIVPL